MDFRVCVCALISLFCVASCCSYVLTNFSFDSCIGWMMCVFFYTKTCDFLVVLFVWLFSSADLQRHVFTA